MREIKFRAWNPNEDIMRYSVDFYNLRDFFGWVCLNDLQDKFTVMQYTGLKDKNGKEIYEGDIVNCRVSKLEGCPDIRIMLQPITYDRGVYMAGGYCCWFCYQYEVIGNIYENPELLKEAK